jgi:ABC-type nickel/cobalt efflux system permease component RcnA
MASWLSEAIQQENVQARWVGQVLLVPAGETYTLKGEIKNVITAVAKTTHYWQAHLPAEVKYTLAFQEWIAGLKPRLKHWLRPALASLIVLILMGIFPTVTWAHPLGNFTVNRYSRLEVGPEQIQLLYIVDMAEIPAFQERAHMDTDQDSFISPAEEAQYVAQQVTALQGQLHLLANGAPLELSPQEQTLEFPQGQGGLLTLRLSIRFAAPLPESQPTWQAEYRDDNYVERLGWQEIVVQAAPGIAILESTAPAQDLSQELRNYPQDLLQSPLSIQSASFRFEPQTTAAAAGASQNANASTQNPKSTPVRQAVQNPKSTDPFAALITIPTLGPEALLLALLAAFGWGAAHALSPGHGKTVVAAYLVGSRGTMRHAIFLGLTTTLTHTAGVFALGGITLFVSKFILPEQLYPWLGVASGLLVVAIGLSLFTGRLRRSYHHHPHSHPDPSHHHHPHDHHHDHGFMSHSHLPPGADSTISWRNLLALGISGGLLPCPSALVVMLSAIALQRIGFGLLLILVFSLGLASVLTLVGILFVHAGRLFERAPLSGRLVQMLPIASALFVTLAGLGITWSALVQAGVLQI